MNHFSAPQSDDLPELQRRYAAGEIEAFEALWRLHLESFRRQAIRQTGGDEEEAQEALGEAALRLLQPDTRAGYQPHRAWKPWAAAVLRNLIIDQQRRTARLPRRSLDEDQGGVAREPLTEELDLASDLADCLAHLPAEVRALLESRYADGEAQVDIAVRLGRSNAWVSRVLKKARGLLRECLSRKGYGVDHEAS
jgi:RNA polymerase sigma factor (sigma-70 family)